MIIKINCYICTYFKYFCIYENDLYRIDKPKHFFIDIYGKIFIKRRSSKYLSTVNKVGYCNGYVKFEFNINIIVNEKRLSGDGLSNLYHY